MSDFRLAILEMEQELERRRREFERDSELRHKALLKSQRKRHIWICIACVVTSALFSYVATKLLLHLMGPFE